MAGELEVLRSQERRLKEKVANMEVALDKVVINEIYKVIIYLLSRIVLNEHSMLIRTKSVL